MLIEHRLRVVEIEEVPDEFGGVKVELYTNFPLSKSANQFERAQSHESVHRNAG